MSISAEQDSFYRARNRLPGSFEAEVADLACFPRHCPEIDYVTVDPKAEIKHGSFVYIEVRKDKKPVRTIRQYIRSSAGDVFLVPMMDDYCVYRLGKDKEEAEILGKVVERRRVCVGTVYDICDIAERALLDLAIARERLSELAASDLDDRSIHAKASRTFFDSSGFIALEDSAAASGEQKPRKHPTRSKAKKRKPSDPGVALTS